MTTLAVVSAPASATKVWYFDWCDPLNHLPFLLRKQSSACSTLDHVHRTVYIQRGTLRPVFMASMPSCEGVHPPGSLQTLNGPVTLSSVGVPTEPKPSYYTAIILVLFLPNVLTEKSQSQAALDTGCLSRVVHDHNVVLLNSGTRQNVCVGERCARRRAD